jgi:tetratricopeptide (TPR) repeat protein
MPDPYSISGQVDMPGGGDPPEPPRIQRVCGSQVDTVAYCDRRGRFNFNLMRNAWSLTPPGAFGFGYFNSCGLRAYMPGFYSPLFSLANRGPYAWPEIGKFRLTSQPGVEGAAVSLTTLAAPKLAKKHFEKALRHLRDAKLEKAAAELELAVEEYPDYAAAWTLLGELRQQLGHESGIREAFERALEADSRYLRPFAPLIRIEIAEGNYEQAAELAERAVRLNPLSAELHYHLALATYKLGDKEKARYHARKAVESDDIAESTAAYALYGDILAQAGERAEAADQYRRFIALHPNLPTSQELRLQLQAWGEPVVSAAPQKAEARK